MMVSNHRYLIIYAISIILINFSEMAGAAPTVFRLVNESNKTTLHDDKSQKKYPQKNTQPNIEHDKNDVSLTSLQILARALSAAPKGGNLTSRVLLRDAEEGDYLPAITWAMANGYWTLAQTLIHENQKKLPAWVRLSMALHQHDLVSLTALLKHPESLPPSDLVSAYSMLDDWPRAQYWAFRRLQDNPRSRNLREQYLDAVKHTASYANIKENILRFSGLQRNSSNLSGRIFVSNNWGILLSDQYTWQSADTQSMLQNTPTIDQSADAGLFYQQKRWSLSGLLGTRSADRNFMVGKITGKITLPLNLSVQSQIAWHQQSTQSPAMAVAGMKNIADIQIDHSNTFWSESLSASRIRYLGQDEVPVGTDWTAGTSLHWLGRWHDWHYSVGPFASIHSITRNKSISGVLAEVLPSVDTTVDNLLAGSYADYGLNFMLNSSIPTLSAHWIPYLAISVYNNTLFGIQYQVGAGIRTPIIGPDQLTIVYSQGQGGNGLALNQQQLDISYTYYFSR